MVERFFFPILKALNQTCRYWINSCTYTIMQTWKVLTDMLSYAINAMNRVLDSYENKALEFFFLCFGL